MARDGELLMAEQGRRVHRLSGDQAVLNHRLQTLERRVERLETDLARLVKVLSEVQR